MILEPTKTFDPTGRRLYLAACANIGVTPVSYFYRHIEDKDMILRHHGLGSKGAKAIAIALVVRYVSFTPKPSSEYLGSVVQKPLA